MSSPEYDWRKDEPQPLEDTSELPLQAPLNFNHELGQRARQMRDDLFRLYRELPDQIGVQEATATNFISPLADALNERSAFYMQLFINEGASPDESIRMASRNALGFINEIENELPIRRKLLDSIKHASEGLDFEAKLFAEYLILKVSDSGSQFHTWSLRRKLVRKMKCKRLRSLFEIRKQLEELNLACQNCINACDVEDLTTRDWVGRSEQYAKNRKQCLDNVSRLNKIITLRDKEAEIFNQSRAEFAVRRRMGRCFICIKLLIHILRKSAVESAPERFDQLLRLKAQDLSMNSPTKPMETEAEVLHDWDYTFCTNLSPKDGGGNLVDWKKLSEYFELNNTLKATIQIVSELFGLKFREVHAGDSNPFREGLVKVWQERVQIYSVWNDFENKKDFLGYLYLDLFSREKKTIMPGHYCLQAVRNVLPVVLSDPRRRRVTR
jgi:Zn-dependent oligopeptidase